MGTGILIVLAASIGFFHNANKSTEYALKMEDGSKENVVLKKNSKYACPIYCHADHTHKAILCDNKKNLNDYKLVYHINKIEHSGLLTYCSNKKITSMSKLKPQFGKKQLPDVVSTSR